MIPKKCISALINARCILPPETWQEILKSISASTSFDDGFSINQVLSGVSNPDAVWLLRKAFQNKGMLSFKQFVAVVATVDAITDLAPHNIEILWSGPANGIFPVRRFDQVLYDLIQEASQRILLVTFAAAKIDLLCNHLQSALHKGVGVALVLEATTESEGQLSFDAIHAFRPIVMQGCQVYYWPLEKRERNPRGKPGKLHAKCAVIDSQAIIGSANLTDDAFNRNLELGLLLRDTVTTDQIFNHFMALIEKRVLTKISL